MTASTSASSTGSTPRTIRLGAAIAAALAAALALGLGVAAGRSPSHRSSGLPQGDDPVHLHPAAFSANIDNPQWPMTVGSRWVYRVVDSSDGSVKRDVITVTARTKLIADGIEARVVRDIVSDHGKPVEVTKDWYAQDRCGNVCYFGEHTVMFVNG